MLGQKLKSLSLISLYQILSAFKNRLDSKVFIVLTTRAVNVFSVEQKGRFYPVSPSLKLLATRPLQIHKPVSKTNENCTADNIAESDWNKVVDEKV